MRILQWCDCYPPLRGGTETVVHRLATTMAADGHDVAVATDRTEFTLADETSEGVSIHRFDFRRALSERNPSSILQTLRAVGDLKQRFRPDIVHVHFLGASGFFHLRTVPQHRAPTLVTIHGGLGGASGGARTVLGELLGSADWVTGVSQAMVDEAVGATPSITSRASVIYNGDAYRAPTGEPESPPLILCFGRHVRDKGFDLVIDAMPLILERYPQARLVIASDGPERSALEAQAVRAGVAVSVTFTGWLGPEALRDLVARSTLAVVPSRWGEGFGLVALEAALAGRPVIAARLGGLPEVVLDGETGLLVDPEDSVAIARAALTLLDDPVLAARLGASARVRGRSHFGLRRQVDAFLAVYARLIRGDLA